VALRKKIVAVEGLTVEGQSEWCGWQQPVMVPKRYVLFCCDCDLAHQFEFKIIRNAKAVGDKKVKDRILYRCRRANGYTQAKRKRDAKKTPARTGAGGGIMALKTGEKLRAISPVFVAVLPNGLKREKKNATTAPSIRPSRKSPRQHKRKR
jgi:hypothetical protein